MIDRYSRPEMKTLWTESSKYNSWATVEKAHLASLVEIGEAPPDVIPLFEKAIASKTEEQYLNREQETQHDVIAFVAEVGDAMGDKSSYLHKGLTSSDILDTSLAMRLQQSLSIIISSLHKVREQLAIQSFTHAQTICIGRTHGIHAEPMSFGQVLASSFAEFQRAHIELLSAQKEISYGKLSGAVGTYSQITPAFEFQVLSKLGLEVEPIATQVIPRDRLSSMAHALISCANATERFAINMRHWARTELGEVLEPFSKKQKGSSAMPHKKNPILAENLCGLSRSVRSYAEALNNNVALWHERDISHSSNERLMLPSLFTTADFMLSRMAYLVENMQVRPEVMENNLWRTGGLWASQSVLTALVNNGLNRTEAYELVQGIALKISSKVGYISIERNQFLNDLLNHQKIRDLVKENTLRSIFETNHYLNSLPVTFKRVFGITPEEYHRKKEEAVCFKIPALQKIIKITVELLPDVLDTEAKTISLDMRHSHLDIIDTRQQKSFLVKMSANTSNEGIIQYAKEVLHNPVMEQFTIEVVQ